MICSSFLDKIDVYRPIGYKSLNISFYIRCLINLAPGRLIIYSFLYNKWSKSCTYTYENNIKNSKTYSNTICSKYFQILCPRIHLVSLLIPTLLCKLDRGSGVNEILILHCMTLYTRREIFYFTKPLYKIIVFYS